MSGTALSSLGDVTAAPLLGSSAFPLMIRPAVGMREPLQWGASHREAIESLVHEYGAVLFRGFSLCGPTDFEAFVDAICPAEWVEYREASTPRSNVGGHVSTSTEYPANLRIYVHNENSHVTSWPLYLFFHCVRPAEEGGYTPLADCQRVWKRLPETLRAQFAEKGWLYRRNFAPGSSFTWQKTFGLTTWEELERYCDENYMTLMQQNGVVSVRYRRWASLPHVRTGEMTWFNHGTFFNPHAQESRLKAMVLAMGEDRRPYNTYYGDGTCVEAETIGVLDEAYTRETVSFPWEAGDVLMLDNMRIAHGRMSYRGQREVLVTMKHKIRCEDVVPCELYRAPR